MKDLAQYIKCLCVVTRETFLTLSSDLFVLTLFLFATIIDADQVVHLFMMTMIKTKTMSLVSIL
jgi:hypothetical protein